MTTTTTLAWVPNHSNWEMPPFILFPSLTRYGIERRPPRLDAGELAAPPPITDDILSIARQDVERAILRLRQRLDTMMDVDDDRYLYLAYHEMQELEEAATDTDALRQHVARWFGVPVPYAAWAPLDIASSEEASSILAHAASEALGTDRQYAVIQPSKRGYVVKTGLGSKTCHIGETDTLEQAVALAEQGILRERTQSRLADLMAGWSPDTIITGGLRWGDYPNWPIHIVRQPAYGASSAWDSPEWAVIERGSMRILHAYTRDDDSDRQTLIRREAEANAQRAAQDRAIVAAIVSHWPRFRANNNGDKVCPTDCSVGGLPARVLGPVRLGSDTGNPLVLVRFANRKKPIWVYAGYVSHDEAHHHLYTD